MKKIKLYGGFHNVSPIVINLDEVAFQQIERETHVSSKDGAFVIGGYALDDVLSPYQRYRVDRHFCGIKDCKCGSYYRDCKIEF